MSQTEAVGPATRELFPTREEREAIEGASNEAKMYRTLMGTVERIAQAVNDLDAKIDEIEIEGALGMASAASRPNGSIDWDALAAPFHPDDLEWKPQVTGARNGTPWARVVPYVTARAIDDRLDDVVGPDRWQVRYKALPNGGLMAEIGVLGSEGDWIWKGDGAGAVKASGALSESDAAKGTFSNAKKRAAVAWGIGRYLYRLPTFRATVFPADSNRGRFYAKIRADQRKGIPNDIPFRWDPPELPAWALPGGTGRQDRGNPVDEARETVKNLVSDMRKGGLGDNPPDDIVKIVDGAEKLALADDAPLDRLTNAIAYLEELLDRR